MSGQLVFRSDPAAFPLMPSSHVYEDIDTNAVELAQSIQYMTTPAPDSQALLHDFRRHTMPMFVDPGNITSYLQKLGNFEHSHSEDVYLDTSR